MIHKTSIKAGNFFKDKHGHVVLWQWPNVLLWSWIFLKLLAYIVSSGEWHIGSDQLSRAVLFAWAYLEITEGVNYFRRLMGIIVLAAIAVSYF